MLEKLTLTSGSVPQVRLFDADATAGDGEDPIRPCGLGSSEMPAAPVDAGHLELLGEIARGGMGAVLKGRDPDLGRDLAVKVLLEAHKDKPDLIRRFMEEAQIAGQLQHPGVVPVYELGAFADHRPYFSMKLVKGRHAGQLCSMRHDWPRATTCPGSSRSSSRSAGRWPMPTAAGVIHRDLKPSNIMVGGFGEVQVMDWGLAKVLASGGVADESRAVRAAGAGERRPHAADRLGRRRLAGRQRDGDAGLHAARAGRRRRRGARRAGRRLRPRARSCAKS